MEENELEAYKMRMLCDLMLSVVVRMTLSEEQIDEAISIWKEKSLSEMDKFTEEVAKKREEKPELDLMMSFNEIDEKESSNTYRRIIARVERQAKMLFGVDND
jgi:hypothetical protein